MRAPSIARDGWQERGKKQYQDARRDDSGFVFHDDAAVHGAAGPVIRRSQSVHADDQADFARDVESYVSCNPSAAAFTNVADMRPERQRRRPR
jgi:hypothetical protein